MKIYYRFVVLFFVIDLLDYSHNISWVLKSSGCESLLLVTSACGVHLQHQQPLITCRQSLKAIRILF